MIQRACYVSCDECGAIGPVSTYGAKDARAVARREEGFVRLHSQDLCQECFAKSLRQSAERSEQEGQ